MSIIHSILLLSLEEYIRIIVNKTCEIIYILIRKTAKHINFECVMKKELFNKNQS